MVKVSFCILAGCKSSSESRSASALNVKTGTPEMTEKSSLNDKVDLSSGGLQKSTPKKQKVCDREGSDGSK